MAVYQGIDPGNTGIRKITIKSGWGMVRSDQSLKPQKRIMALPSYLLTFRQFTFPFTDKKRIRDILPGELNDSLAYPIDDVIWDISSIESDKARTIIVPRDFLEAFVTAHGNSVQVIDAEPCALNRVAQYNGIKDCLIIDMGAHKTLTVGITGGKIDMVRVRLMGGNKLDAFISKTDGKTPEQAKQIKTDMGMESETVTRFITDLFNAMDILSPPGYPQIILTGGGSQLKGLAEFISEKFKVPVGFFNLPGDLDPHIDSVAFGAALYYTVGEEKINLKEKKESSGKESHASWILFLLLPLLLYSFNLKSKEAQLESQIRQINSSMSVAVKKEFPKIGRVVSPLNQVKALIKSQGGTSGRQGRRALDVLSGISKARNGLKVNFYEMDFADQVVKLKGESDTFQSVDRLKTALARDFSKVEVVDQKTKPGGSVDFFIKMETAKSEQKGKREPNP